MCIRDRVANCLEAAEKLAADGIDAEVINIHTIKPIDADLIVASAQKTGKVVTCLLYTSASYRKREDYKRRI